MPTGGALFGSTATRGSSKHLVECKAGKMTMKGKMVYPDKRKGLLYVYQSDDSLMHFCWKDRQSGTLEDDLIIFPDDCEFKRVTQCTTGRVYVLKFRSSNRKLFFWIQEPKTDKDDENCRRINEVLNNPPTPGSQRSGGTTPDGDLQNLLNNMSQQQLMQLFGGVNQMGGLSSLLGTMSRPSTGGSSRSTSSTTTTSTTASTTTSTTTSTTSSSATAPVTTTRSATGSEPSSTTAAASKPKSSETDVAKGAPTQKSSIQLSDLQNFLSGLNVPTPDTQGQQRSVDLSAAITSDNLQQMLGDPALVSELQQHLPTVDAAGVSAQPASEQLRSTLASPQFQQALSMFSTALQSGQLGPVVSQFEVGADAVNAANQGNMEEFVKALQNASIGKDEDKQPGGDEKRKKRNDGKKEDKNDDEGCDMGE